MSQFSSKNRQVIGFIDIYRKDWEKKKKKKLCILRQLKDLAITEYMEKYKKEIYQHTKKVLDFYDPPLYDSLKEMIPD